MVKINLQSLWFIVHKDWEKERFFFYQIPENGYLIKEDALEDCFKDEIVVDWNKLWDVVITNTHDDA